MFGAVQNSTETPAEESEDPDDLWRSHDVGGYSARQASKGSDDI